MKRFVRDVVLMLMAWGMAILTGTLFEPDLFTIFGTIIFSILGTMWTIILIADIFAYRSKKENLY